MAHVGQEFALGAVGRFGGGARLFEFVLLTLALGDIAPVEHQTADGRIAAQVGGQDLDVAPGAVGVTHGPLRHQRDVLGVQSASDEAVGLSPILRAEIVEQRDPRQLAR